MAKDDFTPEEFQVRLARLRRAMAQAELDWLLVIHPVSMRWLVGQDSKSFAGFQCLPVSVGRDELIVFAREMDRNEFEADSIVDGFRGYNGGEPEDPMEAFAAFADDLGLRQSRVAMEVPAWYLHPYHYLALKEMLGDALVMDGCDLLQSLTFVKSPRELDYVRKSAAIADAAWRSVLDHVADGRSELELAAVAYRTLLAAGSGPPASTINLMTGERSCFPLGGPTERRHRRGETGLIELGGAYRRYTSTLGRQWVLGKPTDRLRGLHETILAASDACMAEMRAGVPAVVPHEAAKSVIAAAGLDRYRQHTTGYGMAAAFPPAWGEATNMFGDSQDVLEAGMVMTVEPAVFIKDEGLGVRLIDNCVITETGIERLSRSSRELVLID